MAYFPEYYGGEMWSRALSQAGQNIGNSIAQSLEFYRKRHEQTEQLDKQFQEMRLHNDPTTGKPYIDQKTWERINVANERERHANETAYMAVYNMGQKQLEEHAKLAHLNAETLHAQRLANTTALTPAQKEEQRLQTQDRVKQARFREAVQNPASEEAGDWDGKTFTKKDPKTASHVRIVSQSGQEIILPKATVDQMRAKPKTQVKVGQPQGQKPPQGQGPPKGGYPKMGEVRNGYRYTSPYPYEWRDRTKWEKVNP